MASIAGATCTLFRWAARDAGSSKTTPAPSPLQPLQSFQVIDVVHEDIGVSCLALSPDCCHVAFGDSRGQVFVWQIGRRVDGASGAPPSEPAAGAGATKQQQQQRQQFVDVGSFTPILVARLVKHSSRILSIAFSGDGQRMITASADGTCVVFDVGSIVHPAPLTSALKPASTPKAGDGASSLSGSTESSTNTCSCHVLPGQGKSFLGDKFVSAARSRRGAGAGRWQCKGAVMVPDGKACFVLESSERGGAVLSKWRLGPKAAAGTRATAATAAVPIDGSSAASSLPSVSAEQVWFLSTVVIASKTPLSAMSANAHVDRLALGTADGGVRVFDADTLFQIWFKDGIHTFPIATLTFLQHSDALVTGSPDAAVALVPLRSSSKACSGRLMALILLLLLSLLFAIAWLVLAEHARQRVPLFGKDSDTAAEL